MESLIGDVPPHIYLEVLFIVFVPVAIVLMSKRFFRFRLQILAGVFLLTVLLAVIKGMPQELLGFTAITSGKLLWYCAALVAGFAALYVADKVFRIRNQRIDTEIILSSLLLSFAQEFIFNGYFLNLFISAYSIPVAVIAVGVIFAVVHQPLEFSVRSAAVSFCSGIFLATVFVIQPNLYLAALTHSALNVKALQYRIPGIGPSLKRLGALAK